MSPQEVVFRAWRAGRAHAERLGWTGDAEVPRPDLSVSGVTFIAVPSGIPSPETYAAAAGRIADGWLDVFALKNADLGTPPRWNRDPKTGIEAPLTFGKLLDYRDPDRVGDIKYLWEPNRHLQLVTLAQAWALTRRRAHLEALRDQLDSWFIACPYPQGPNWSSALEAAIRLANWSLAWQLIGGAASELFSTREDWAFRDRWLASVWRHARFVRGWLSRHSSANNHLIGEACGLYLAAATWPHWREAREWRRTAKAILEREALAQNAPDGVNREQAVSYQQFVLDMLLLPLLAGKAAGEAFSPAYRQRIEAMLDFLASIMDCAGNVPMIGDADDGYLVRLCPSKDVDPYKSLLATGALLFKRGDFKEKAGALDDKTRWLLGPGADAQWAALNAGKTRLPPRQQFAEGGYYVLGCDFETPREIRLVADAGPLGYRSIAAHGHADALAFTLSAGGRELLVDPGTYAYHTQARWRAYFRGTAAHNTVRIDGLDQSEQGGNFLWLRKARAACSLWLSSAGKDSFEGWHDGYCRLEDPVKHRRLIELDKRARRVTVEDVLEMQEAHDVELFFHFSERCAVEPVEGGGYLAWNEGASMKIVLPPGGEATLCAGSVAPIAGWISRAFDRRAPSPTLAWRARLAGNAQLRTEIEIR